MNRILNKYLQFLRKKMLILDTYWALIWFSKYQLFPDHWIELSFELKVKSERSSFPVLLWTPFILHTLKAKMGDELTLSLEVFHKIKKATGQATLSIATAGGKTKMKLEIWTTPAPPTESSSTSSPSGHRHRRCGQRARARRNQRAAAHQAALAEAAASAPLEDPPPRPPLQLLPSPPAASGDLSGEAGRADLFLYQHGRLLIAPSIFTNIFAITFNTNSNAIFRPTTSLPPQLRPPPLQRLWSMYLPVRWAPWLLLWQAVGR